MAFAGYVEPNLFPALLDIKPAYLDVGDEQNPEQIVLFNLADLPSVGAPGLVQNPGVLTWVYLIPLIKQLSERVTALEAQLQGQ